MSITSALKGAGYVPEKSTAGDKPILKGVYKCLFVDFKNEPDGKFGPQMMAKFQIVEKLSGMDSRSTFPQFTAYYKTDDESSASKRNGIAKLLNGFYSVGKSIDTSSDETLLAALEEMKGSCEVFISAFKKSPRKEVDGQWVDNPDGEAKQDFSFMTEKNAKKEAEKEIKKAGHPL